MPNWCNNVVEISHGSEKMMDRAVKAFNEGSFLNEFIPVPEDLNITAGCVGDADEQKALEAKEQENLKKHGYKNWYDFCVNEWGTKWDVEPYEPITLSENGSATLAFDSAWAPPVNAYEKLEALGFSIRAYYYESGMGFAGIYEDGIDDYYELQGNADEIENTIPEALNEMFCITENIRQWEEENQEIDLDGGLSSINE